MRVREIIWLKQFSEKIEQKHGVIEHEVEEVFMKQPPVRRIKRGNIEGEDLYRAVGQTDAGRYLAIFFIYKGRERALVISARDAHTKELRSLANARSNAKKRRDPLPVHFSSLEEASEFWDTHDSGDYEEYFEDVRCEFDLKKRTHVVSIDGALYDKVRAVAKKKRVPADKLVARWIQEKLRTAA